MISRTSDTATSDPSEVNPWQEHRQDLGEWVWNRLAVKRDRHGIYSKDGKAKWSPSEVTPQKLAKHFAGEYTLGLGTTSSDDLCLWVAWDLDNHVSEEATNQNLLYAIILKDRLIESGFRPLVEDSDGKGGIHVWVLFTEPIPAATAHQFAAWVVRDYAALGLEKIECFPKSPTVQHTSKKCGNYLRIPAKHHKRDHWSRFWGADAWLTAADSVQLLLCHTGDDPSLIPDIPAVELRGHQSKTGFTASGCDCDLTIEALHAIPNNDLHYDDWLKIAMALHACDETLLDEFQRWSARSQKHNSQTTKQKWKSFSSNGKIQPGTIFHIAKEHGWSRAAWPVGQIQDLPEAVEEWDEVSTAEQISDRTYGDSDLNDIGNSKHFAKTYGDQLRYCAAWKKWLCWDGCRWKIDDEDRPLKLAKELTATMFLVSLKHREKCVFKHVCGTAKLERLKAMITLAGSELPIKVSEMDTNHWVLNCTNGMVELKNGKLLEHDRSLSITKLCPTEFQPDAESPLWKRFLRDVFVDDELIQFIQRVFGYFLTGDVSEQKLPIFFGTGANGKSTVLNAFMETVGMDWEQHVRRLQNQQVRGHHLGCRTFVM